ncbi:MAG: hypothetical protein HYV03_08825, partial [Deltaproteobacteria bacterium]|nr:hypothetical protein [Deltaproteobacteria bacterium]
MSIGYVLGLALCPYAWGEEAASTFPIIDPSTDCVTYYQPTSEAELQEILDNYLTTATAASKDKRWICFDEKNRVPIEYVAVVLNKSAVPLVIYGLRLKWAGPNDLAPNAVVKILGDRITLQHSVIENDDSESAEIGIEAEGYKEIIVDTTIAEFDKGIVLSGAANTVDQATITGVFTGLKVDGNGHSITNSTVTAEPKSGGYTYGLLLAGSGHVVSDNVFAGFLYGIETSCNNTGGILPPVDPSCVIGPNNAIEGERGVHLLADSFRVTVTRNAIPLKSSNLLIGLDAGANGGVTQVNTASIGLVEVPAPGAALHVAGGVPSVDCPAHVGAGSVELFVNGVFLVTCPVGPRNGEPMSITTLAGKETFVVEPGSCYFDCGEVSAPEKSILSVVYTDPGGNSSAY